MARSVEIPLQVIGWTVLSLAGVLMERAIDHHLTPPSTPVILKAEERGRMYPSSAVETAWWKLHVDIQAANRK